MKKDEGNNEVVKQENLELGNTSSNIMKGGLTAEFDGACYYATDDGILRIENEHEDIISKELVSYLNAINDKLYYTTHENKKAVIKVSDLYGKNQRQLYSSNKEIKMMYVVNDEYITFLEGKHIYKLDLESCKHKYI